MHVLTHFLNYITPIELWLKKTGRGDPLPVNAKNYFLLRHNFSGLRPFLAHAFLKFNGLPFSKGLEPVSLDFREMNKKIFSALGLDKTITLTLIKPLYCTF